MRRFVGCGPPDPRKLGTQVLRTQRGWTLRRSSEKTVPGPGRGNSTEVESIDQARPSGRWRRGIRCLTRSVSEVSRSNEAQHFIEQENLDWLHERNHLLRSLLKYRRFLTTDELALRVEAFIHFQEQNRSSLLQTGYPTSRFTSWPWPPAVNLYPVKRPENLFEDVFTRDRNGREANSFVVDRPAFVWRCPSIDVSDNLARDDASTEESKSPAEMVPCRYEEAPLAVDLALEDVRRLEASRAVLLDLKIRLLQRLAIALRRGSPIGLWDDCLHLLSQALLGTDADFLLAEDSSEEPSRKARGSSQGSALRKRCQAG